MVNINKYTLIYYSLISHLPFDLIRCILDIYNESNKFMSQYESSRFVNVIMGFKTITLPKIQNWSNTKVKEMINLKLIKIALDYTYFQLFRISQKFIITNVFFQLYNICHNFKYCGSLQCKCAKMLGNVCILCSESSKKVLIINDIELCIDCITKIQHVYSHQFIQNMKTRFISYYEKFIAYLDNTCYHYLIFDYNQRKIICLNINTKIKRMHVLKQHLQNMDKPKTKYFDTCKHTEIYVNLCMTIY
jgi:hypothetical protein